MTLSNITLESLTDREIIILNHGRNLGRDVLANEVQPTISNLELETRDQAERIDFISHEYETLRSAHNSLVELHLAVSASLADMNERYVDLVAERDDLKKRLVIATHKIDTLTKN
jgi:chromosome segregation ATPase